MLCYAFGAGQQGLDTGDADTGSFGDGQGAVSHFQRGLNQPPYFSMLFFYSW